MNLAKSSSIKNVKYAKQDVEISLKTEKANFEEFLKNIWIHANIAEKKHFNNLIRNHQTKVHKMEKDKYEKKLSHLKFKNDIPTDEKPKIEGCTLDKSKSKNRRFIKRSKYVKWKKKEFMKQATSLVVNYSDFPVTEPMKTLLNKGLSFVPTPEKLNITQLKADIDKYSRICQ